MDKFKLIFNKIERLETSIDTTKLELDYLYKKLKVDLNNGYLELSETSEGNPTCIIVKDNTSISISYDEIRKIMKLFNEFEL
jgi:hypothetical protein